MSIDKPKVFISYCWSDDKYIKRVVDFANRLRGDGVDVVLDQFHMKLGNDLNNFMEKCVSDPNITNVLILLSPDYKIKADARIGGAGKETQIISGEVYNNVENKKFIPILFDKRGKRPEDCMPTYLSQRRWIDLSDDIYYEDRYIELVKALYGANKFFESPLGSKPEWVDSPDSNIADVQKIVHNYRATKKESGDKKAIISSCNSLIESLVTIKSKFNDFDLYNLKDFEKHYSLLDGFKIPFLGLVDEIKYDDSTGKTIHDLYTQFLKIVYESRANNPSFFILSKILIHELFIETIVILIKGKNYKSIGYITRVPYINPYEYREKLASFKDVFYSCTESMAFNVSQHLGETLREDHTKGAYFSGLAEYWRRHLPVKYVDFKSFIDADCLLTNISIPSSNYYWFALSYCYRADWNDSLIYEIALSLKSKTLAIDYYPLFGWKTIDDAKRSIKSLEGFSNGHELRLAYSGSFLSIPMLCDYIKDEDVGEKD